VPVSLFLSSTLRRCVPGYEPSRGVMVSVGARTTIADLCTRMGIPVDKVRVVMVNGRNVSLDFELQGDERVGLFPPIGGG